MISRFYRWLYRKSRAALESRDILPDSDLLTSSVEGSMNHRWHPSPRLSQSEAFSDLTACGGINLSVHRATGGYVIETRQYDKKTDTNVSMLHIVVDESDLGTEIGKIITLQMLRM